MSLSAALGIARRYANGGGVNTDPSPAQKEAGNYKKKHIVFQGIPITIENPKGTIRSGLDHKGQPWSSRMTEDYGYIKRTEGHDGDQVDCFVGPNKRSNRVWVVDQLHHSAHRFDEHKCLLGFDTEKQAIGAYRKSYGTVYDIQHAMGAVTEMSVDAFKEWLKGGGGKKPISPDVPQYQDGGAVLFDPDYLKSKPEKTPNVRVTEGHQEFEKGYAPSGRSPWNTDYPYRPILNMRGQELHALKIQEGGAVDAPMVSDEDLAQAQINQQTAPREGGLMQTIPQFAQMIGTPEGRGKLWEAAKTEAAQFIPGLIEQVKGPGEALAGKMTPEQQAEWGAGTAMGLIGMHLPFRYMESPGNIGVFGSRGAVGHDAAALENAEKARSAGISDESIWNGTGWTWEPHTDKPIFHIPVHDMNINPVDTPMHPIWPEMVSIPEGKAVKLDNLLPGERLYNHYPFLRDVDVVGMNHLLENPNNRGAAFLEDKKIALSPMHPEDARMSLLHEIQHFIQDYEGLPQGGAWQTFLPDNWHVMHFNLTQRRSLLNKLMETENIKPDDAYKAVVTGLNKPWSLTHQQRSMLINLRDAGFYDHVHNLVNEANGLVQIEQKAKDNYLNLAGEAMARNAEARSRLNPEESREVTPQASSLMMRDPIAMHDTLFNGDTAMATKYALSEDVKRPTPTYSISPQGLYSRAEQIASQGPAKASPKEWLALMRNKGLKAEEDKYVGLSDWLNKQTGPLTKDQVQGFIKNNKIQLRERLSGEHVYESPEEEEMARILNEGGPDYPDDWENTRYQQYQMGGPKSDYKEMVIQWDKPPTTLEGYYNAAQEALHRGDRAEEQRLLAAARQLFPGHPETEMGMLADTGGLEDPASYHSSHWPGAENPVAHTRFNTRDIPGVGKALNIEEIQSDLHQQARKVRERRIKTLADEMYGKENAALMEKGGSQYEIDKALKDLNKREEDGEFIKKAAEQVHPEYGYGYGREPVPEISEAELAAHAERSQRYEAEYRELEIAGDRNEEAQLELERAHPWIRSMVEGEAPPEGAPRPPPDAIQRYMELENENARIAQNMDLMEIEWQQHEVAGQDLRASGEEKGILDAPFKKTWHELVLKRMLHYAVKNGFDALTWTPGEVQAARYNLGHHVESLSYSPETHKLKGTTLNGDPLDYDVAPNKLDEFIGKESADKIMNNPTSKKMFGNVLYHRLEGSDLFLGGKGMFKFYDEHIPNAVNSIVKRFGMKAERQNISIPGKSYEAVSHADYYGLEPDEAERAGYPWAVVDDQGDIASSTDHATRESAEEEARYMTALSKQKKTNIHVLRFTPEFKEYVLQHGFPYRRGGRVKKFAAGGAVRVGKRIKRNAFLYMNPKPPKDSFAQCGTCLMFTGTGCTILGKTKITKDMTCGLYVRGKPQYNLKGKEQSLVTPKEVGLVDTQVRCENCRYGGDNCQLFEMLNSKLSNNFDLDTKIDPKGCCNAFTPEK